MMMMMMMMMMMTMLPLTPLLDFRSALLARCVVIAPPSVLPRPALKQYALTPISTPLGAVCLFPFFRHFIFVFPSFFFSCRHYVFPLVSVFFFFGGGGSFSLSNSLFFVFWSFYLSVSFCLFISLFLSCHLFICEFRQFVFLSVNLYLSVSFYASVSLAVCVCLSVCLAVRQFVCVCPGLSLYVSVVPTVCRCSYNYSTTSYFSFLISVFVSFRQSGYVGDTVLNNF